MSTQRTGSFCLVPLPSEERFVDCCRSFEPGAAPSEDCLTARRLYAARRLTLHSIRLTADRELESCRALAYQEPNVMTSRLPVYLHRERDCYARYNVTLAHAQAGLTDLRRFAELVGLEEPK